MALVNGSDYDHIDLHSAAGGDVTRHMLKDAQARQDVSDLKSAINGAIGINLAGTSIGHLYPVHILSGSKITVSTSNGSTFDQTVKLHYWGQNKNHIGQWSFGSSYGNSRTITVNTDIYWLSFEWQEATEFGIETGESMQLPYMVNFGTSAEGYQAWFEQPQIRALRLDMDAKNTEINQGISALEAQTEADTSAMKKMVGMNLAGPSIGKLYPVHILAGDVVTVSTSDGSTFPAATDDAFVKLHYWNAEFGLVGRYSFNDTHGNKRTVPFNGDVAWLSWEKQDISTPGEDSGVLMTVPYMVEFGASAHPYQVWFEQPQVYALRQDVNALSSSLSAVDGKIDATNQYRNEAENPFVSLNANYFDADHAAWHDGILNTNSGTVTATTDYEYAFCPLRGAGGYITQIASGTYGANARRLALYDANQSYIKYIDCDSYDGNNSTQKYTLSPADAMTARYTVLQRKKDGATIPKLFYQSIFTAPSTFPVGPTLPLPPVYGTITDPLYKKVVVCDGDSICAAALDNPYQWQGWFGRILRGYQTSGKNYAVGGGTIMDRTDETVAGEPRHCISLDIDTIYNEYPELDYLILEGGTNDADLTWDSATGAPGERFGTWDEYSMSAAYVAALDTTTFCGAVEYLFWRAITYYPHAKIGFIVAMSMGTTIDARTKRKYFFDEIVKIAKKWGIPVLNLWENVHAKAGFDAYWDRNATAKQNVAAKKFYNDGQHPTSYGYNLMQPMIEAWIKAL